MTDQVLAPCMEHSSQLLRSAAQAVVASLSPGAFDALPQEHQRRLLSWGCMAAADEASPVRAAAAKALGAVAACPALLALPGGEALWLL
jgi:hypothetical protein